ncbi:MAG TPA: HD domain-containing phosphohydrolase [Polyangiales bacterium]|nr:HD domain-containing phosphohydrolase [Polyangiales bacterium]
MYESTHDESPRILVVDDEEVIRDILADFLSMEGFEVRTAADGNAALRELTRGHCDIVLSDLKMPNMGGIELLDVISREWPQLVTIIMTGFGTVETAIDAMKRGAYDYIMKPFKMEEVVHTVRRGLERRKLTAENMRLKEALSLYKVSEAIAASLSLDEVMRNVTDAAIHEVDADLVSVWLQDGTGAFFERARVQSPRFTPAGATGVLSCPQLVEHFADDKRLRVHGERCLPFFSTVPEIPVSSMLATQLTMSGRPIGFLAALSFTTNRIFDEGQRKLLSIVSDRAAAAIENAKLYEDLKATFSQTIKGLASAIDKMDRYTAGHSTRVAAYSQVLAIKLGLPAEQVEIVRQAALMHDIGKIGCVMNLNKPGILTDREYEVFKHHPGYGRDILEPIEFLSPLIPGVHLHHERWDGRGYPLGLRATGIPLIARIISVADAYDAMTSDRAYRRALPHSVTMTEIQSCAGSQFDPDVAGEFSEAIEAYRHERKEKHENVPE